MQARGSVTMHWAYYEDLAIGANFVVPPGGNYSGMAPGVTATDLMPVQSLHYFAIDVYTDDLVNVEIQIGMTVLNVATMATLICPAGLRHNTIYDLPPPFPGHGVLTVTGHFMALEVTNTSGNVVSPFNLVAKVWG